MNKKAINFNKISVRKLTEGMKVRPRPSDRKLTEILLKIQGDNQEDD